MYWVVYVLSQSSLSLSLCLSLSLFLFRDSTKIKWNGLHTLFLCRHYLFIKPTLSLVAQLVKNPPAMWETWVWSLGWEDPLEKGKAIVSSILAWRIPWGRKELDTTEQLSLTHSEVILWTIYVWGVSYLSSSHPFILFFLPLFFLFFFFSFLNASIYRKLSIFVSMLQPQYPMANLTDTILEDRFHSHQWGNVAILFINLFTDNIILFKLISTFKNSSQL